MYLKMKKSIILALTCFFMININNSIAQEKTDAPTEIDSKKNVSLNSFPAVFTEYHADLIDSRLKNEAFLKFAQHQLPTQEEEWKTHKALLREKIIRKAGIVINQGLALDYQETDSVQMEGYTIKNILFQTRPGVYATANLYIPEGEGPFPAVINMHGHWANGRLNDVPQSRGPSLALNGYVCLNIDAFGSGERTTEHGIDEYHGGNLGASLMNIGESLLGFQVSDNMRGVDLLSSLPYVDAQRIGATGASGGGNQTMWLSAIDERIKASMPVVSVGTFESAVMGSNCVGELLIDGLTFTETSAVLGLIAPRALKMVNHHRDSNLTFYPAEMLRSYRKVKPLFEMLGAGNNIDYELFDLEHGYWPEDREAMLGWFDRHLKGMGTGASKKEFPFVTLPKERLMVFPVGERDPKIESISEYCRRRGNELRTVFLQTKTFDKKVKQKELREILRINQIPELKNVHQYSSQNGWDRFALETSNNKLIPLLHIAPRNKPGEYVILSNPEGKRNISPTLIDELKKKGSGIVLVDLSGTGETSSIKDISTTDWPQFHTLARAQLWLGRTIMGEWVSELYTVSEFLSSEKKAVKISMDGNKEAGLAALFLGALEDDKISSMILRNAPISYMFDTREGVDFFSMAIHLPGFLQWGDISLAAALGGKDITFINPVTMSGNEMSEGEMKSFRTEFEQIRKLSSQAGKVRIVKSLE